MSSTVFPSVTGVLTAYKNARLRFFRYRREATVAPKIALAVGLAAVTGLAAQIRVPLPFTPVPITLQTFAVLLAGIVLGMRFGGLSQAFYIGGGLVGVPWFRGGGAGLGHLLGPTGGYLIGFVVAAVAIGYLVDRYRIANRLPVLLGVLILVHFTIIYGFGLLWLYTWSTVVMGSTMTLLELLTMGLFPFIPGDSVKILAAAAIGTAITPVESP